ncbi:MAG: GTP-binding protein, partial [Hyphomicrobium sp.]
MTALTAIRQPKTAIAPEAAHELNGVLNVLTCGSVDDGKSTLIGRLLWDASDLYDDQRETLRKSGRTAGGTAHPDFSL